VSRPEGPTGPAPDLPPADSRCPRPPAQLPLDVNGFVGREIELSVLDRLLQSARAASSRPLVAVISGPAGVGKTALAVHWAYRVREQFPDGQLHVNLRGLDPAGPPLDTGQALRDVLQAVGVPGHRLPPGRDALVGLYRTECSAVGRCWCWTTPASPPAPGSPLCYSVDEDLGHRSPR
jgi:hypothetical protein